MVYTIKKKCLNISSVANKQLKYTLNVVSF